MLLYRLWLPRVSHNSSNFGLIRAHQGFVRLTLLSAAYQRDYHIYTVSDPLIHNQEPRSHEICMFVSEKILNNDYVKFDCMLCSGHRPERVLSGCARLVFLQVQDHGIYDFLRILKTLLR